MKALTINATQNCPLDIEVWGERPLRSAVYWNDVDAASALLQRGAVIETEALAETIDLLYSEMVKIFLENGADVHAETDYGEGPQPIHEFCAQKLQSYERGNTIYNSDEVE